MFMSVPPIDMLRALFDAATWQRGTGYHRSGRARVTWASTDGTHVKGEVIGSRSRPYKTEVRLRVGRRTGRLEVTSTCSCPMVAQCKHVVALLLRAHADDVLRLPDQTADARASRPAKPSSGASIDLSPPIQDWLRTLEAAGKTDAEDYPDTVRQRLIYGLFMHRWRGGTEEPRVKLFSVRLLKDGSFSETVSGYNAANIQGPQGGALFLRPSDRPILKRLAEARIGGVAAGEYTLKGEEGAALLDAMLETGRARWGDVQGPEIHRGEPRPGRVTWVMAEDGRQRPTVEPAPDDGDSGEEAGRATPPLAVLPLVPPWVVMADASDPAWVTASPMTLALPPRTLAALLAAPALEIDQVEPVRARLSALLGDGMTGGAPEVLPRTVSPPRRIKEAPVPCLRIFAKEVRREPSWGRYRSGPETETVLLARPSFRYAGIDIAATEPAATVTRTRDGGVVQVIRSKSRERAALRHLADIGFVRLGDRYDLSVPPDHRQDLTLMSDEGPDQAWLTVLLDDVPSLREDGWHIAIADDFPLRPVLVDGDFEASLDDGTGTGSGIDWLELNLGVMVDGERVDVLPALLGVVNAIPAEALQDILDDDGEDGSTLSMKMPDGRLLVMPFGRVRPILKALVDLLGSDVTPTDGARLSAFDMADLTGFEDAVAASGVAFTGGEAVRALGRRLRDAHGIPPAIALPAAFTGTLRPYQAIGVAWMQLLREVALGGILADDMGLGKTVQALAHLSIEKAEGRLDRPSLVIAPTSLMGNWQAEAAQFAPHLRTLVLQGPDRKADFGRLAEHDLVFSTYPLLSHDAEVLGGQDWHLLILDEAQMVKNPATTAAKTLRRLTARHRLALTGTPVENNLGELWALYDAVSPGLLGDRKTFTKHWRTPIEKKGDTERQARLSRRLRPFLLRRTKGDVLADLPPRTDIVDHVTLCSQQRAVYEGIRLAMHAKVRDAIARKGLARSRIELLEALLRLRQVCCDPRLVAKARQVKRGTKVADAGSAKLDRLMDMLPEMVAEGRRVLLFSQFTSMLDLIESEVTRADIPFVTLTGQTRDRTSVVKRFQSGTVPLFLVSLKAGGTGLNLTAADTVIHYDPWWNPAVEAQATDRAHRIGQDKPVFVYKLIAGDTIEVKMQALKDRKQALADGLYDPDGATPFDISEEDVEFLLGEG